MTVTLVIASASSSRSRGVGDCTVNVAAIHVNGQDGLANLGYSIARPPNLDEGLFWHLRCWCEKCTSCSVLRIICPRSKSSTTLEVCLMFFSLGVCEVGSFICMHCEAQTAFQSAQMISKNVRILSIYVSIM